MYIKSIGISKIGWNTPKEGEDIEYGGKITFGDEKNQEFTFCLTDETARLLTLCVMDRVKETADDFTNQIKSIIQPKNRINK